MLPARAVLALMIAAPALAAPKCDPTSTDLEGVAAARRAIEAACACDGFSSHRLFVRCAQGAIDAEIDAGRLASGCRSTVRKIARRSTCSYGTSRVACCSEARRDGGRSCAITKATKCTSSRGSVRTACGATTRYCADTECDRGGEAVACGPELLYASEGNRLRRFDVDTIATPPLVQDVLIPSADEGGLDINGQVCSLGDGANLRFVAGEDTGQPTVVPGWGVFDANGGRVGKLAPTFQTELGGSTSGAEPFGCAVDADGRLFTSDVGNQATGAGNGQLLLWFPPYETFPGPPGTYPNTSRSTSFCKLAIDVGTAGSVATDRQGRVYLASARGFEVLRFSPPFPTGPDAAGGCGGADPLGSPLATTVSRATFIAAPKTFSGLARRRSGNWFVGAVFNATIDEYDPNGVYLRTVLEPAPSETAFPRSVGHPQGLAVDCKGDLYHADLSLVVDGGIGPGPNGTVRRIPIDVCGQAGPNQIVRDGLAFPDGLGVLPGDLQTAP
jgi:hypothetical protein